MRCVPGEDYPKLDREVIKILHSLNMTPRHIRTLYKKFQELRSFDSLTINTTAEECTVPSVMRLIRYKRDWVSKILMTVMELGGFREIVNWNGFLFVLLKLCTLSKIELAQALFFVIVRDMQSWTVHYVTTTQLQEFYEDYDDCEVRSFDTGSIGFSSLPMAKYRMVDFIQLTYRYSQLINPFIHLQRSLQQSLLSLNFWNDYDRVKPMNRKVTLDFFRSQKVLSLAELITGVSKKATEAAAKPPDQQKMVDGIDPLNPKSQIKRRPHVDADLPIPSQGPGAPGWTPYRGPNSRRVIAPPLPAWVQEKALQNVDPVRGIALGSLSVPKEQPRWSAGLAATMTVEHAVGIIHSTHRQGPMVKKAITVNALPEKSATGMMDWDRAQELDFICKSRGHERRRVDVLKVMEKSTQQELIARPDRRKPAAS